MQTIQFQSRLLEDGHLYCPKDIFEKASKLKNVVVKVVFEFEEDQKEEIEKELGVTEEEIKRIMKMQGKDRQTVINFLKAEGSLAEDEDFEKRIKEFREGANRWRIEEW